MYQLLEFAFLFFFAPYILFGVVLGAVAGLIINFFQPAILMASVWFAVVGAYLSAHRPDTKLAFKSVLGRVAEGLILTVGVPNIILGIAGFSSSWLSYAASDFEPRWG
ncbi:hypothetical protein QO021_29910 (plasmid) [Pseudomonas amygdali pv. lachrymans]|uniref:hypothetical protein n=1 Tax=Pseudomonas amygdali TaxID=47877 RepID=UPI0006B89C9A|nr:hypothetical protein [Pseudomonas amygdali]RMM39307.1 hypothetical protein ALQ79_200642 [Pseudomonas amygdali pv. lachrymans]WIO61304.1 hypothetical protein QO021_29910 [Pseudomonas amygdali pv. lachrymans]